MRFPLQTALAIGVVAAILSTAHFVVPAVRPPGPELYSSLLDFTPDRTPLNPLVRQESQPEEAEMPVRKPGHSWLEDSSGTLDSFYAALWRTERGEPSAITRIVHYGDSPTTADLITGDVRTLLQHRFGDGGPGFTLIAKPWAWYQHHGVDVSGAGWQMDPASKFISRDGLFGFGGVSFTGGTGAHSAITYKGSLPSEFEIWYLAQPEGGELEVVGDGVSIGRVATASTDGETHAGFHRVHAAAPVSQLELRVENGRVRMFGVSAEKPGPGVVYDSLGLNGASIAVISRMYNREHWTEELQHRHPDLLIVNYGTNEADFASFVDGPYEKDLREAIRRARAALPGTSIMLMSPMDRGQRGGLDEIHTMPTIPKIVAIQQRVAADTGLAFFNTYEAMGGEGTIARWYQGQPRLVSADLIHPVPAGGKIVANAFVRELMLGYNRFKLRHLTKSAPGR